MKKKILFATLLVAMLVCVFALSVSAAGSSSNAFAETADTLTNVTAPSVISTTEKVVLLGADGLYYTYPAYYIVKDHTTFSIVVNNALNAVLGYADGTNLANYVVRIEVPTGITYMSSSLNYKSNLVYVKMSDTIIDAGGNGAKTFQGCTNLETLIISNNLTAIPGDFCHGCTSLKSIEIPASVAMIYGYSFNGCSKLSSVINYSEKITEIGGNAFSGCPITEFNFPDALQKIGSSAFTGAAFSKIDIPDSVTTIGQGNFSGCKNLSYLKLPESLSEIPHDFMKQCNITVVVPKGCEKIYGQFSFAHANIQKIIFTGTPDSPFMTRLAVTNSGLVSKVEYANHCDVYYDKIHNTEMSYVFTSFIEGCYTEGVCSRCGITEKGESFAPIFTFKGYSMPSDKSEICSGYTVNLDSLDKYNENRSENVSFKYGFVASANNNSPISEDGTFGANVVNVDLTNEKYAGIDFRLSGDWSNANYSTASISMNIYTIVTENGKNTINYIYGYADDHNNVITEIYTSADSIKYSQFVS